MHPSWRVRRSGVDLIADEGAVALAQVGATFARVTSARAGRDERLDTAVSA